MRYADLRLSILRADNNLAKKELGDNFHVKVTCAHLEIQDDADLDRFAKLEKHHEGLSKIE